MIRITYERGGKVKLEPSGYPGQTCHEATRPYVEHRGGTKESREVEPTVTETAEQKVVVGE